MKSHKVTLKYAIKQELVNFLFDYPIEQLKTRLFNLIKRNTVISGFSQECFTYRGGLYDNNVMGRLPHGNKLVKELIPIMDEYLADYYQLHNKEIPLVTNFITKILNQSSSPQDYLRIFPDCVHTPILKFNISTPLELIEDEVVSLKEQHKEEIDLMKQRLVLNLIT